MTALRQKLLRDLRLLWTQAAAISLVVACGVATFVMSVSVLQSLERRAAQYYEDARLPHVFAHLKRAPVSIARRVAEVPGIAAVETRVVAEVTLDLPGVIEPAVGRLVSIPDHGEPSLSRLHLRQGRWPDPGRRSEVLANEAFAEAHGLVPGDRLRAVMNGRREQLIVVGIALSPEYIYQIRGGDVVPDDRRFGVLWMRDRPLAAAFDLANACNDLVVAVTPGASLPAVRAQLDVLLAPYGGRGAYGRDDQVSYRTVANELSQLRAMALLAPVIFLLVAAFILNVVLNRMIATQREQIATLKAFGYTRWEIGAHYLQFALLIVLAGAALGTVVGAWLGSGLADLYVRFFRFPDQRYSVGLGVVASALGISLLAGVLSVAMAIRRVVRLAPAEAMRPEAPRPFRGGFLHPHGSVGRLSPLTRLTLRQIARHPVRAVLSALGIALGIAVMVLGSFSADLVDRLMEDHFEATQRFDFSIAFIEPSDVGTLHAAVRLPGVLRAEGFRSVAVRLRRGTHARLTSLLGLEKDSGLLRPIDVNGRPIPFPARGLLLSEKLAQLLDVRPGETVEVEVLEGARPVRALRVAGTVRDFAGQAAYLARGELNDFLREGAVISGAFLLADPLREATLYSEIKETPRIGGITSTRSLIQSFKKLMSENMLRMRLFNVIFASIIAFGVVYNAARITLSERAWELATLRVIGLSRREVSATLLGEIAALTALAIPVGLLLGNLLARLTVRALETETQHFPLVIDPSTYATAVLTVVAATVISSLVVRRRIDRLDLVAVLKSHD